MAKKKAPSFGYRARMAVWSAIFLLAIGGYVWQSSAGFAGNAAGITGLMTAEQDGNCHASSLGNLDHCSESCQCYAGEGDCDSDWECIPGTVCVSNAGEAYGYDTTTDVCMVP